MCLGEGDLRCDVNTILKLQVKEQPSGVKVRLSEEVRRRAIVIKEDEVSG